MTEETATRFSTALPVIVYTRPAGENIDWQEADRGPGFFNIPANQEIRIRIKGINDFELNELMNDLHDVQALRYLDLSENRNVTNDGLARLKAVPQLTGLNLSSCTITSTGMEHLRALTHLQTLILSYCSRLTDPALKTLEGMKNLTFVDLQGCLGLTQGGLARIRRRSLTIYR